ncbi:MAG: PEGA domain-containing protein, partial [Polyangiales bacterium]
MNTASSARAAPRLAVASTIALVLFAQSDRARAEEWVLVPATAQEAAAWVEPTLEQIGHELTERGISLQPPAIAATQFEERGSAPASELSPRDLAAWKARSREALTQLARHDYAAALEQLEAAQSLSRSAIDELNREPQRARLVLDTCLYAVRALLGLGQQAEAQAQAEECARLSLHAKPSAVMHPPDVRAFYSSAVDGHAEDAGTLLIESEPSSCEVYVNGLAQGRSPRRLEALIHGRYEVQAECDEQRGRVHSIDLASGSTQVIVDTRFDQAVRTDDDRLELRYATWPNAEQRGADARALAEPIRADAVVLMFAPSDGPVDFVLLRQGKGQSGFARIASNDQGPEPAALAKAAESLLAHSCVDLSGEVVAKVDCTTGVPILEGDGRRTVERANGPPRGQFIAGVTLASVGTASLLSAFALYGASARRAADRMVASPSNENQARWLDLRFGTFYVGSAGAAALVATMPLALPYRAVTPW